MLRLVLSIVVLALSAPAFSQEFLSLPAKPGQGAGAGKKIVLVAGDEEYRTEETMPMLAKILSQKHGFNCVVLFSTDPAAGFVDPNNQKNIRGTEALNSADLLIIGTRFRQLPAESLDPNSKAVGGKKNSPMMPLAKATGTP